MQNDEIIKTIKDFFEKLNISIIDVKEIVSGDIVVYNVLTNDSRSAIGKNGEHLDALHHLLSLMFAKNGDKDFHFNLDVNGHKQTKMNELMFEVHDVAKEVIKFKKDIALRPMTSYERLIVHNMFSGSIQIETKSEGEAKDRHIVLSYMHI